MVGPAAVLRGRLLMLHSLQQPLLLWRLVVVLLVLLLPVSLSLVVDMVVLPLLVVLLLPAVVVVVVVVLPLLVELLLPAAVGVAAGGFVVANLCNHFVDLHKNGCMYGH